ncbi:MAG: HlyD family efflux transporter periplasmic adaptor subunit, partial [Bifidobacteriaceae bacterium]|nr:HlyD family efflux transporter periplasmic adaptor subunit [Bifidobacteriaceae bacterium]
MAHPRGKPRRRLSRAAAVNIALGAAVLVAAGVAVFLVFRPDGGAQAEGTARTATVQRGTVSTTVTAQGNVAAAQTADVTFDVAGEVEAVAVTPGQSVKKGAVLATIAADDADEAVAQAQAAYDKANRAVTQANYSATSAGQSRQAASLEVEAAEDKVEAAKEALDRARAAAAAADAPAPNPSPEPSQSPSPTQGTETATTVADAEAQLASAQASLSQARSQYTQAASQVTQAEGQSQDAQADLASALQVLEDAKANAQNLSVTAPFDALVTEVNLAVGDQVGSASAAGQTTPTGSSDQSGGIALASMAVLEVTGSFDEADAAYLGAEQAASVAFPALDGESAEGKVTFVSPVGTANGSLVTYQATVRLDSYPEGLRLGQTATIEVVTQEAADVLYLPANAVQVVGDLATVQVVDASGATET